MKNTMDAFWMPFTANKQFKAAPRLLTGAKGVYYTTDDGRQVLDSASGLWCCSAGHGRTEIVEAISRQAAEMDYAPGFQMAAPKSFEFANRVAGYMPDGLDHVFFTNSGSESVDTALKIAIACQRLRGEGARTRLIGRELGYHGVGFGGISVGGMVNNRKFFGSLLPGVDHLPATLNMKDQAFTKGQPQDGAYLADDLERLVTLHDASTIAAVIVEPVAGSAGVIVPPVGYLERLREICTRHGILLIFDEVITAFGRLGANTGSEYFGVTPDIMTTAKGLTSGTVPMGAVIVTGDIFNTFMDQPGPGPELFHGFTYSAHPLAVAAGLAVMDIYDNENLFARAADLAPYFEEKLHSLRDAPHVIDIRNLGLMGAVHLASRDGAPGARAYDGFVDGYNRGVLYRIAGDIFEFSPPFICEKSHIDDMVDTLRDVLENLD